MVICAQRCTRMTCEFCGFEMASVMSSVRQIHRAHTKRCKKSTAAERQFFLAKKRWPHSRRELEQTRGTEVTSGR